LQYAVQATSAKLKVLAISAILATLAILAILADSPLPGPRGKLSGAGVVCCFTECS
jgi:hypothetical protein